MSLLSLARLSSPVVVIISEPNSALICSSAGEFGATTSRATSSKSTTGTPSEEKMLATLDLPLAMPPVKPTIKSVDVIGSVSSSRCQLVSCT